MGYLLPLIFLFSLNARADLFGFGSDKKLASRIPALTEKLQALQMKGNLAYEDEFNTLVKGIESALEEEKLFCAGEVSDAQGKVLVADQKQLCFRDLKKSYVNATTVIFDSKKKFLSYLHDQQQEKLTAIQKRLREDIEKNF
jgi:hypothetical protein